MSVEKLKKRLDAVQKPVDYDSLTYEEKLFKVAECVGKPVIKEHRCSYLTCGEDCIFDHWESTGWEDSHGNPVPDYPNDLNACHEFELEHIRRNSALFGRYEDTLTELGDESGICATAEQRCKAFVLTMEGE